ncbi:MAG: mechanosensitive ion channel family protein [Propionivibrio sp.]
MDSGASLRQLLAVSLAAFFFQFHAGVAAAAEPAARSDEAVALDDEMSAPVVVDGITLFKVRGVSSYPAEARAKAIAGRIVALAADSSFDKASLKIDDSEASQSKIMTGNAVVLVVLNADARQEGVDRITLARSFVIRIGEAVDGWREDRSPARLARNAGFAAAASAALVLVLWGGVVFLRRLRALLEKRLHQRIQDVHFQGFRIFGAHQIWALLTSILSFSWVVTVLIVLYLYLGSVLVLFPWTRELANKLISLVLDPLRTIALGLLETIPKLVFLLVLYFLMRYLLKMIKLYFQSVADERIVLPEFDADWAWPTYRLIRLLLIAFAVIVAYPYIPGSGSEAFKGVSLFIGVVFSLGSSSVIGNMIAGYTMTYRRAFKVGDRVKIGEHLGDVEMIRVLVTYLRTPKNEVVAIPNSSILNGDVVNYSTLAKQQGVILHTTVGIGYETPWRQVEAMLLEAAARTPGLLREPPPFVRHNSLGDFCVVYEINVYCAEPQLMGLFYTELHRNILDVFNEYGVQIMTPAYEGDPEQAKLVPRDQWFTAPAKQPESGGGLAGQSVNG